MAERLPNLWLSRSWTSRPRRANEAADAYTFVDEETFRARVEAGGFIEWAEVFGHLYGTPEPEPPAGSDILLEIDVQGAGQVRARHPDAVVILVEAPSRDVQDARLRARGDDPAVIARRLAQADAEEAT
ncbi:MAG: guanylate kinase, partial [Actinomycetota bacterium]|nr:guanylate kinase [Actinomycetota bacterium]